MDYILNNIEAIRKEKGYKQEFMAQKMGVKQNTYSTYISAGSDIPFSRLSVIADIFEMPIIDIITYPEKYVPISIAKKECEKCTEKDRAIKNLNDYIEILKNNTNGHQRKTPIQ